MKEHPTHVSKFEACQNDLERDTYWISKSWLKGKHVLRLADSILTVIDWKLVKPKMHTFAKGDLPPDSEEYQSHVRCEHGGLCLSPANRCRVSAEASGFLRSLFPAWEPLSGDLESCLICEALKNMGEEDKLEVRRRADDEKVCRFRPGCSSSLISFLGEVETHV